MHASEYIWLTGKNNLSNPWGLPGDIPQSKPLQTGSH